MSVPLHLLVLEDNPSDAELVIIELRRAGFEPEWKRVETEADFLAALDPTLELILADYRLPQFDGLRALNLVQERKLGIPLLIVSGTIGEELAVEAMKKGAADYLLKDRLARLGPAVKQALERKQVKEKLGASENEMRALFNAMTDVVLVLDGAGRYLSIAPTNPAYLYRMPQEMLGKTLHEVLPKQPADYMLAKIKEAIQTKHAVPGEYALSIDGKEIWFASSTSRLSENSVIWVAHDITERKQAEELLKESTEQLREAQKLAHIGVWDWKPDTDTVTWTEELYRIAGLNPLLPAPNYKEQSNLYTPESWELLNTGVEKAMGTGESYEFELELIRPNGDTRYVIAFGGAKYDPKGQVIGLFGTVQDITERKRVEEKLKEYSENLQEMVEERTNELRQAQEQLVRKEKLAMLGTLAGGVGHELRNPLGVISNSIYYLNLVQPEANEKIRKHLGIIEHELSNATRIVSDLLDYAREINTQPQPGSVSELVEYALNFFPVPASISIKIRIPADLPQVYADPLDRKSVV
jgi:PAS domain S-box-containing protein